MSGRSGGVVSVVGARPQFIKAAVVSAALARAGLREVLVHTGQHYDAAMSDVFFRELALPAPTHHLGIGGLSHGAMTGRMMEALERVVLDERPAWVLVYGDTNSTLAGALVAAKLKVPVAHVEAGMRSYNRSQPEELNRVVADHVSTLLLVTNETPRRLLAGEGILDGVEIVGDVMYEALLRFRDAAARTGARAALGLEGKSYGLATVHRAENTDDGARLRAICAGLEAVGRRIPLVLPLHPRTRRTLERVGLRLDPALVRTIEPVGYLEMLDLEAGAAVVLTDSGGVQKEAFFHGVPCVTLRDETEWTETVELGWNALVGADPKRLAEAVARALDQPPAGPPPAVYGDGRSAERIAQLLGGGSAGRRP